MKKFKLFGIIAVAVIGFSMAGCGPGGSSDDTVSIGSIPGITQPAAGASPVTGTVVDTTQYTGTVQWEGSLADGKFNTNTVYTATITLTAKAGYTFTGVTASFFSVSGATSVVSTAGNGNQMTVTAAFPQTGSDLVVNIAAIPNVPVPAFEVNPSSAPDIDTAQYTGSIEWTPTLESDGTFGSGKTYTAAITLTAKTNWTFNGVSANFFTNTAATTVTNPAGTGTEMVVTAVFPPTGNVQIQTVNIAAIEGITPPVTGETAVLVITETAQYTGTVEWSPALDGGKFAGSTGYTAEITLTAKAGFTLIGVGADFFTVDGAKSVTNAASSGIVEVDFSKTEVSPLQLSGQVVEIDLNSYDLENGIIEYKPYTGSLTIDNSSRGGGSGTVSNGQLSFSIGEPTGLGNIDIFFGTSLTANPVETQGFVLSGIAVKKTDDPSFNGELSRSRTIVDKIEEGLLYGTGEHIAYIYVTQDVNISAVETTDDDPEFPITTKAFNINLKTGWNMLHFNEEIVFNVESNSSTTTRTLTLVNSSDIPWAFRGLD